MHRSRSTRPVFLALTVTLVFACAQVASGASGGAGAGELPQKPAKPPGNSGGTSSGGTTRKQREARRAPVIAAIALSGTVVSDGSALTLRYRIKGGAKRVRVRGVVRTKGGRYVKTLQLGVHRTRVLQTTQLTARELGVSRAGSYKLRLTAVDRRGRAARRAKRIAAWHAFSFTDHRFPLTGPFSFGSTGAVFGAGRPGHIHQGQDVIADAGTPIVAPYGGTIAHVDYQAGGAGYYVVEHSDDGRDYVFMHMQKDSILVAQGQRVVTGQRLGLVGSTGQSSGPHLHFEIWTGGPWQFGGKPVDPLPLLKSWLATGAGGAVRTSSVSSAAMQSSAPDA